MAEALFENAIERISRALLAQLQPLTGERAEGTVRVTATAPNVVIPRSTYLCPVVRGQFREDLVYKTIAEATIPLAGGTADLPIVSNVGGARHNQEHGTVFRFDPPVEGLALTASAVGAIAGGSNVGALLRSVSVFEDLDATNPEQDFFAAMLGETPAAILSWLTSEPLEGATSTLRRGSNRTARGLTSYRESFVIYLIVTRLAGVGFRRQEGLTIMQAVTRLLVDRMQNDDGEQLATIGGGVEIESRARLVRRERHYIYAVRLRTTQTAEVRTDARTFERWERTRITGALPGREAPEPTEPLTIVDTTEPMP